MCNRTTNSIIKQLLDKPMNYNDLYIIEEHQNIAKELLNELRSDFPIIHGPNKMKSFIDYSFNFLYAKQIAEYYNNDICITATHLFIMQKNNSSYTQKSVGYFFDGIVQKIFNCWDYIFQSLNIYWDLNFLSSTKEREILSEIYTKKWDFIEDEDGIQLICSEYDEAKLEVINQKIKKDLKVLHADTIKKQIKKDGHFSIIPEFDMLMNLYNDTNCIKLKKEFRNPISHSNSTTFKMKIDSGDLLFPTKSLSYSNKNHIDDDAIILIKNNLELLQKGIQLLLHIIWNNIVPNSKLNENKTYYGVCLKCENCNFEDCMTQETFELFQKYSLDFLCPECAKTLVIKEKLTMTERDHISLLLDAKKLEQQLQRYLQNNTNK